MKRVTLILLCSVLFTSLVGCEEILTGIGIGAAATETLDSWEENLEAKGIELTQEYEEAIIRIRNASDPNELAFETEKVQQIQIARAMNLGVRTGISELREKGGQLDQEGGYLNLLHGLIPLALGYAGNEIRKRIKSERKRAAYKHGSELALRQLAAMDQKDVTTPVVKEKMYENIGIALKG